MMYRVRVIACGVFILVAQPALAFNQLDGQDCLHQRDNDLRIEACTRILDEANEPANVRADQIGRASCGERVFRTV